MKLVLGTASLGMNYGLFSYKKINRGEFKKIEKLVLESKIKLIDMPILLIILFFLNSCKESKNSFPLFPIKSL